MQELVGIQAIAETYPRLPDKLVSRDQFMTSVKLVFDSEIDVIVIEGNTELGKTTFLAQFIARYSLNSICLFLRPTSTIGYEIDRVRFDLGNQLHWYLNSTQLDEQATVSGTQFRDLLSAASRKAKRSGKHFYIAIDGLADIPEDRAHIRDNIIELVLLGLPSFKFLLSANSYREFQKHIPSGLSHTPHRLTVFTDPEAQVFLSDSGATEEEISSLHQDVDGMPGPLASARRLLLDGVKIDDIQRGQGGRFEELFRQEWKRADTDDLTRALLSALAFVPQAEQVDFLCKIVDQPEDAVLELIRKTRILVLDEAKSSVTFISDAVRRFATDQLRQYKNAALDAAIKFVSHVTSEDPLSDALPGMVVERGEIDKIVELFSDSNIAQIYRKTQSVLTISNHLARVQAICLSSNQLPSATKFGLQQSALLETLRSSKTSGEVYRLLADKKPAAALKAAHAAYSVEERLNLLAIIINREYQDYGQIDPTVEEEIRALAKQLDITTSRESVINIASQLIGALPEIAVEILKRSLGAEEDSNLVDLLVFQVLTKAIDEQDKTEGRRRVISALHEGLGDTAPGPLRVLAVMLGSESKFSEIDSALQKFEKIADRVLVVRLWLLANSENENATRVVSRLIPEMMRAKDYTATAGIYCELTSVLLKAKRTEFSEAIANLVLTQKDEIERVGPFVDFVRTLLNRAIYIAKQDQKKLADEFYEIYVQIGKVKNPLTRIAAQAWYLSAATTGGVSEAVEREFNVISSLKTEIEASIIAVCKESSDHSVVFRQVVDALSRSEPLFVLSLIKIANTQECRDELLKDANATLLGASEAMSAKDKFDASQKLIAEMWSEYARGHAQEEVVGWLCGKKTNYQEIVTAYGTARIKSVLDGIGHHSEMPGSIAQIIAVTSADSQDWREEMINALAESLGKIDGDWRRHEKALRCYSVIVRKQPELAPRLHFLIERSGQSEVPEQVNPQVCMHLANLMCRAFAGMVCAGINEELDYRILENTMNRVPTETARAQYWAMVALKIWKTNEGLARQIVNEHIRHIVNYVRDNWNHRSGEFGNLLIYVGPAIWKWNSIVVLELIKLMPISERHRVFDATVDYIAVGAMPRDPRTNPHINSLSLEEEEIQEILTLAEQLDIDEKIRRSIKYVYLATGRGANIRSPQKTEFRAKAKDLANRRLPTPRGISHNGYRVWCEIDALHDSPKTAEVDALMVEISAIGNQADEAFLRTMLVDKLPLKMNLVLHEQFQEARIRISRLPSFADRVTHLLNLVQSGREPCETQSKEALRIASREALELDKEFNTADAQRELLDVAYTLDPEFAAVLASQMDSDPAKKRSKSEVQHTLSKARAKKDLFGSMNAYIAKDKDMPWDSIKAGCRDALAKMNSGTSIPIDQRNAFKMMSAAADKPLSDGFDVYSYCIEGLAHTYFTQDHATKFMRPIFHALESAVDVTSSVLSSQSESMLSLREDLYEGIGTDFAMIGAGDNKTFITFVQDWLSDTRPDTLRIVNSYFEADDLLILKSIRALWPDLRIQVITGYEKFDGPENRSKVRDLISSHWKNHINSDGPNNFEVVFATYADHPRGKIVFHERWWLAGESGLFVGTSLNGIGDTFVASVKRMNADESKKYSGFVDSVLSRRIRQINGEAVRVDWVSFDN